jgi:hypothetical protein
MVGLFFFIRASVKERTEQIKLIATEPIENLLEKLQAYFEERSYRAIAVEPTNNTIIFQGFVRPSWFLAIFLSFLAGVGFLCLALILALLFPSIGQLFLPIVALAPIAGIFYWRQAGRLERISLKVEKLKPRQHEGEDSNSLKEAIAIVAHRDELAQLQQVFASELFVYDN